VPDVSVAPAAQAETVKAVSSSRKHALLIIKYLHQNYISHLCKEAFASLISLPLNRTEHDSGNEIALDEGINQQNWN
jgi:hypothetical protein